MLIDSAKVSFSILFFKKIYILQNQISYYEAVLLDGDRNFSYAYM